MRRPTTTLGRIVLTATLAYVVFWLVLLPIPDLRAFIAAVPLVGEVLDALFALCVAGALIWVARLAWERWR